MTTKSLEKMKALKEQMRVISDQIYVKKCKGESFALLKAEFGRLQVQHRRLWNKQWVEQNKEAVCQAQ